MSTLYDQVYRESEHDYDEPPDPYDPDPYDFRPRRPAPWEDVLVDQVPPEPGLF